MKKSILFVTPTSVAVSAFRLLEEENCESYIASDIKSVQQHLEKSFPIAIVSRAYLPGYRVEELFTLCKDNAYSIPIIIALEKSDRLLTEKYMELGAQDIWEESSLDEKILCFVRHTKHHRTETTADTTLQENTLPMQEPVKEPIGEHHAIQKVIALAKRVAASKATILINGESGTGKEVFAKYIHSISDRAHKPFIAINCAALPEHLLESELFGHEKGSFTGAINKKYGKFELADGGTILLDEISEMAINLQAKLLRVLQEGEIDRVGGGHSIPVDVRVIATTNRDLPSWVEQGGFRQDLYFRLNVIPLTLPPLRDRGNDIQLLAQHFLATFAKEYKMRNASLSSEALEWLQQHEFTGNVRELQNLIERAILLAEGGIIQKKHFLIDDTLFNTTPTENMQGYTASIPATDIQTTLMPIDEMERIMILKGLQETAGNRTHAAELLGISVRTLRNKINEYRAQGYTIE